MISNLPNNPKPSIDYPASQLYSQIDALEQLISVNRSKTTDEIIRCLETVRSQIRQVVNDYNAITVQQ